MSSLKKIHESMGEVPRSDHNSYPVNPGMVPVVQRLWQDEIGWTKAEFEIMNQKKQSIFVIGPGGAWLQFSDHPKDLHPGLTVKRPSDWADATAEWLHKEGFEEVRVQTGSGTALVFARALGPWGLEFVEPE